MSPMACISRVALFFLGISIGMAQTAQELSKLSKEKLVALAASKMDKKSFKVSDFTDIQIWLEGDELQVIFSHAIQYIPAKGQFYYAAHVELVTGSSSLSIQGKGPDDEDIQFYSPAKFKKQIKFVFDAINKSDEVGSIPEGQLPEGTMKIYENIGHYDVSVDSYSTHSSYKVKKGSGKIYDAGHKHFMREEGDEKRVRIY